MVELLQYAFIAAPYLIAFGLAIGLVAFCLTAFRSPTAGIALYILLFWFDALFPDAPPLQLGLFIYVADLVAITVGLVALLRAFFAGSRPPAPLAWYVFLALVVTSFGFGLPANGTAAGTALRPYFYAIVIASYCMTFPTNDGVARRALAALGWAAAGMLLLVLSRWVIVVLPVDSLLPPGGRYDPMLTASILRVIGSDHAAVLGGVFVVGLFYAKDMRLNASRLLTPVLAVVVIGLQHRSVWLAVLAAVAARFVLPAAGRRGTTQLLGLALVLVLAAVPVALSQRFQSAAGDVSQSAGRAAGLNDTANVRLQSWKFAIDKWRDGGPKAWAIGLPLGTSMERYLVTGGNQLRKISFQAHNNFVQMLFNFGLLGLGAILALYAVVMRRLYRLVPQAQTGPAASALLLLLALQLAYYMTYGVSYMQGMVLGVAVAYAMTMWREVPVASASVAADLPPADHSDPIWSKATA